MNKIFEAIVGSQSYGTATPTSDVDIKGVFIQPMDDILGIKYKEQRDLNKDTTYYEVKRFLELCAQGNPNILELLYSPKDCILIDSPQMQFIRDNREIFLTQRCRSSFGGYAVSQIKKAKGLNKKMNWERDKVIRKTPLDFCFSYSDGKTMPLRKWLKINELKQEYCGLVKLNNFKDCYSLYYDYRGKLIDEGYKGSRSRSRDGYKGITKPNSNSLRLSSIPKGALPETIIHYNQNGYSQHCKDFNEYQEWLSNRNEQRYVDVKGHNQQVDGKNLMHCIRLIDMCEEIALHHKINVKRPNADYLLSIRRGEVSLESLIEEANSQLERIENLNEWNNLPVSCDVNKVNELLIEIRKYD